MRRLFFISALLVPLFFLLLSFSEKTEKEKQRKLLLRESALVFCAALLFLPVLNRYFSLSVQAFFCAAVLFLQFFLLGKALYRLERKAQEKTRGKNLAPVRHLDENGG